MGTTAGCLSYEGGGESFCACFNTICELGLYSQCSEYHLVLPWFRRNSLVCVRCHTLVAFPRGGTPASLNSFERVPLPCHTAGRRRFNVFGGGCQMLAFVTAGALWHLASGCCWRL